jgi:uncharacterized protein YuzE
LKSSHLLQHSETDGLVQHVVAAPEQRFPVRDGRVVLQSRVTMGRPPKMYLVRVVIDIDRRPAEVLEGLAVKITYDRRTDTLSVVLKDGVAVAESDEDKPGVILDYDAVGDLVSLEILDASRRVTEAGRVEYQTTG